MASNSRHGRKRNRTSQEEELKPIQSYLTDQFNALAILSEELARKRPRLSGPGTGTGAENWSYYLENVIKEAHTAIHVLSAQETSNYRSTVNGIMVVMVEKLETIGNNMIDIYKMGQRCPVLVTGSVQYWNTVKEFLPAAFSWAEGEIVKVLMSKTYDRATKKKAIDDILDHALDLLWGIYA